MKEKECFKCKKIKPLSEYYKHAQMGDGHLNKCKECTKSDVGEHRLKNLDKIREYDRKRGSRQSPEYLGEYRRKYPNKYRAHSLVQRTIRRGDLVKKPCVVCGSEDRIEAHHDESPEP